MEKKTLLIVLSLLQVISLAAQNNFYFAQGERIYWDEDRSSVNIIVQNRHNYDLIVRNLLTVFSDSSDTVSHVPDDDNIIVISKKLENINLPILLREISPDTAAISFVTYSKKINNRRIWLRNEVYVSLKEDTFYSTYVVPFLSHFSEFSLQYDSVENDYIITCDNENTLIQIANGLYDTNYVNYSTPDFYSEGCLNTMDPHYPDQWALNNTGQDGGAVGVDIKAEKAWAFLQRYNNNLGDSIRVAVIDNGVADHEDLKDAYGSSRVLPGFPAWGHGAPYTSNQYHGQACSGIIAASHNNVGVAGVAPNVLIVPIRIMRDQKIYLSNARIGRGITNAWEKYHAQILSNSWGTDRTRHSLIDKAFQKAIKSGRDANGCIVVMASGNNDYNQVEYPANLDNVIAVGAVDRCGTRAGSYERTHSCEAWPKGASSYGSKLSVVAPGSNVYSTDRMGSAGLYPLSNYLLFEGTSAACPHVSGVAALILSVNPNLTHGQVKAIIEKTAQKVGPYYYESSSAHPNGTWHEEMGYGMVNALLALAEAKIFGTEFAISGPLSIQMCNEYTYTLSGDVPEGYDIVWETNLHLCMVSGQGTHSLKVRPLYPAVGNWVRVKICYDGEVVRELETNYIVSTGTGIYPISNHDTVVSTNTSWIYERSLGTTAVVDSGATLTITNTIHCTDNARLIVRPGGKLVVDGGVLTSACPGEMWQGIEVVGDRTKRQLPQYQGTVELRNGAVIENAHCGIHTGLQGDASYATTGGIILADSANFVNNRRSVAFLSYENTRPNGSVANNLSSFRRCVFSVNDNNHFMQDSCPFIDHVTMWEVRGVKFKGCRFENTSTMPGDRRHAIYTENAGFEVNTRCDVQYYNGCECPEPYTVCCEFSGFTTAVEANTDGDPRAVVVNGARFFNNVTGVKINGTNFATVTRNDFNLQSRPSSPSNTGLYLNACGGYQVEGNRFHRAGLPVTSTSTGIRVENNGNTDNSIYRNVFDTLSYGIDVYGANGDANGGLQMLCGDFNGNVTDIHLATIKTTVSQQQGSLQISAGNTFDGTSGYNIQSLANQNIVYFHTGKAVPGNPHYPGLRTTNVFPYLISSANPCASTFCSGGTPKSLAGFQSDMNAYSTAMAAIADTDGRDDADDAEVETQNFASLQQGGTESLSETAQSLSDTYYTAVRALMADSLLDLAALEQWHTAAQPIADPYSLTETRFSEGYAESFAADVDDAEMANYAEFHAMKLVLRNNVADNDGSVETCHGASLQDGHINWYALTPAQIAQLQTIAERNTGRASVLAKGVLCFFHGICYEDDLLVDDNADNSDNNAGTRAKRTAVNVAADAALAVYPNPTDDLLHIELSGAEIANIALYDLQGRMVTGAGAHAGAPQRGGNVTINMRSVPAGVYLLRVTAADGKEYQRKIVKR